VSTLSHDKTEQSSKTAGSSRNGETNLSTMIGNLAGQLSKLARQEVSLAKAEIKQVTKKSAKDGAGVVAGAVMLHAGLLTSVATICLVLAFVMPLWAALLTVSAVLLIGGAATVKAALNKLQEDTSMQHLPDSLKTNREFLKEQAA